MVGSAVRRRWGLIAVASALAASVLTVATLSGSRPATAASADGASNHSAAQSDAGHLLALLRLPPGATRSATEPAGDGSVLAHPFSGPPATPDVIDDYRWWALPEAPKDVLNYIDAHRPSGSSVVGSGN